MRKLMKKETILLSSNKQNGGSGKIIQETDSSTCMVSRY